MSEREFEEIRQLFEIGDLESAFNLLETEIEKKPNDPDALYGLGIYWLMRGKDYHASGKHLLFRSIDNGITRVNAYLNLGSLLAEEGLYKEAEGILLTAVNLGIADAFVSYYLMNIYFQMNLMHKAQMYLETAISIETDNAVVYCQLARMLKKLSIPDVAKRFYEKAIFFDNLNADLYEEIGIFFTELGAYAEALTHYEYAINLKPKDVIYYFRKHDALKSLVNFKASEDICTYVINNLYETLSADSAQKFYWHNELAFVLSRQNKHIEAKKQYQIALEAAPENSQTWGNYGITLMELKHYKDAINAFNTSITLNSKNVFSNGALGSLYVKLGKFKLAEKYLVNSISYEGYDEQLLINYGSFLVSERRQRDAITFYEKYLNFNPSWIGLSVNLVTLLLEKGDYEKAEMLTRKALEIDPGHEFSCTNLAHILTYYKLKIQQSLEVLYAGLHENPNSALIRIYAAIMERYAGNFEAERYLYQSAIDVAPSSYLGYMHLGGCFVGVDNVLAKHYLNQANILSPNNGKILTNLAGLECWYENYQAGLQLLKKAISLNKDYLPAYELLCQLPGDINNDKDNHFYRYCYLTRNMVLPKQVHIKMDLAVSLDIPMLIDRIAWDKHTPLESLSFYDSTIEKARKKVEHFKRAIKVWKIDGNKPVEALQNEAVINFYLGDYVNTYYLLTFEMDPQVLLSNPLILYCYIFSSQKIGEWERHRLAGIDEIETLLNNATLTDQYYIALIYEQTGKYSSALNVLRKISPYYRQAQYKLVSLYKTTLNLDLLKAEQRSLVNKFNIVSELSRMTAEILLLEKVDPYYMFGIDAVSPSMNVETFLEEITPILHFIEIEDILGTIFAVPSEIKTPFYELIVVDKNDEKFNSPTIKDRLPDVWKRLALQKIDPLILQRRIASIMPFGSDSEIELAAQIRRGAREEYFDHIKKYQSPEKFEFRMYIATACSLYNDGWFTIEQTINLVNYAHHCMMLIPRMKGNVYAEFIIDTIVELIIDSANIPLSYWLIRISQLNDLLRQQKNPPENPIPNYLKFDYSLNDNLDMP